MNIATREIARHFAAVTAVIPLHRLQSERDYRLAVHKLDELLDAGGADESDALGDLVALLGEFVEEYERRKGYALPDASGADVLRFLMHRDGLRQSDLPEIGSQGVVSEILSGKRDLNARQIRALAQRFNVGPAAFI
jgi:HTH-type transcriptional regulator / antitoxin HigA